MGSGSPSRPQARTSPLSYTRITRSAVLIRKQLPGQKQRTSHVTCCQSMMVSGDEKRGRISPPASGELDGFDAARAAASGRHAERRRQLQVRRVDQHLRPTRHQSAPTTNRENFCGHECYATQYNLNDSLEMDKFWFSKLTYPAFGVACVDVLPSSVKGCHDVQVGLKNKKWVKQSLRLLEISKLTH